MSVFFRRTNILDPYSWTTGSGSIGSFSQNGSTDENERVIGTDPFGNSSVLWETRANGTNADDGGWNHGFFNVDNTKLYRMSVWVKRTTSSAGGTFYFGTNGGGQCVLRLSDFGEECNPYWDCKGTGSYTQNVWYLIVGHVFPHTYPNSNQHADTGEWVIGSGKVAGINGCNVGNDMKFGPNTTSLNHRTYHFYCGDNTTRLQFFNPRVDLCDGSEPRITDLLNNTRNSIQTTSITTEGATYRNQRVVATGGVITEVGEFRIHRFNSSGTFTVSSLIGTSLPVEYLVVGGGGGGGMDMGGGGGGGGVLNGRHILTPGSYTITVGAGGVGAPAGSSGGQPAFHQFTIGATNGGNSSFFNLTSIGGGFGASSYYGYTPNYGTPGNGGSGGGPSGYSDGGTRPGGSGTSGQGFNGGSGGGQYYSGGGGGAGGVGTSSTNRPDGGNGRLIGILGKPLYFGGGGGGGSYSLSTGGYGGLGGGGGGALGTAPGGTGGLEWGQAGGGGSPNSQTNTPGGNAGTNTGGGGGGGSHYNLNNKGGNGGSGIVIIRYKFK